LDQMILAMNKAWDDYEIVKKQAASLLTEYNQKEADVINTLKAINKTKYFVEGVGNVSLVKRLSYKLPDNIENKEALFAYIRQTYGEDALKGMVSINSNKLNAWAKEENESKPGIEIPGLGSPSESFGISIRKK
jgi:hypothetical protein